MGKDWDKHKGGMIDWVNWFSEVMAEAMRVMKPGAIGLVWSIPRTSHWTGMALELAGFRIIDVVHHCQGSGFPKGQDIGKLLDKMAGAEREVAGVKTRPDGTQRPNAENWANGMGYQGNKPSPEINTKPATPEAQQWDGWKTPALKPAVEGWYIIEKPRFYGCLRQESKTAIIEWHQVIQRFLVLCINASFADKIFSHQQNGFVTLNIKGAGLDSVLSDVVTQAIRRSEDKFEGTDMFRSQGMGKIALSIVSLWSHILEESYIQESISTTSMGSNLTTGLRTCYLWTLQSISQNTIHQIQTQQSEEALLVQNVELFLKGCDLLPEKAMSCSALGNVVENIGVMLLSSLVKIAGKASVEKGTIASIVQSVAVPNTIKQQGQDSKGKTSDASNAGSRLKHGNHPSLSTVLENAWLTVLDAQKGKNKFPAVEGWWLVQKPISESSIARNILQHGVGGLNIEAGRIGTGEDKSSGGLRRRSHEVNASSYKIGDQITRNMSCGRYPSNLILSCGAECDGDRHAPDCPVEVIGGQSGVSVSKANVKSDNRKQLDTYAMNGGVGERNPFNSHTDTGTAARYFKQLPFDPDTVASVWYEPKASPNDRSCGGKVQNVHPTVKSRHLMAYFCKLITPPGGVILDPFGGSGTTALGAIMEGFNYVLIEQDPEYIAIIKQRIATLAPEPKQPTLEERVQWLETQVQAQGNKLKKLEANQQLSLWELG